MVTNLKMHKAFPQCGYRSFKTLFFYISPYIRVTTAGPLNNQHNIKMLCYKGGNVVIPVQRKYQRLTSYGFDQYLNCEYSTITVDRL